VGGGEGVVGSINGVTTTWLTSVLQRATAIPAGASVASFTHSIIGQGRGHSNVIYKLTVKYTGAGGAPAPSELVLKLPNNDFLDQHIKPRGGEIIAWFNRTYACEVGFYSHQYGKTPDVFCRPFFTASEAVADPTADVGRYNVLLEYLGDDAKLYSTRTGMSPEQVEQALSAAACVHGASWNDTSLLSAADGGDNTWINGSVQQADAFLDFAGAETMASFVGFLKAEVCERMGSTVGLLLTNYSSWYTRGFTDSKCLSAFDLRPENLVWRCCGGDKYTCTIVDHQAWTYQAPAADVTMLAMSSLSIDQLTDHLQPALDTYYAALQQTAYTKVAFMNDFRVSLWNVLVFSAMAFKMAITVQAMHDQIPDGAPMKHTLAAKIEGMSKNSRSMAFKVKSAIELFDAYSVVGWMRAA